MSEIILCVFEGKKEEPKVFNNIKKNFFEHSDNTIVQAIYGTVIYNLWQKLKDDEFLDLVEVLREGLPENEPALDGFDREAFSQVFLFFDHDGHASNADDSKIEEMLEYFDEETENGKLYISYPMVESLKDLDSASSYKEKCFLTEENKIYKKRVGEVTQYPHVIRLNMIDWHNIITENLKKGNYITTNQYSLPDSHIYQDTIFEYQLSKYIQPKSEVAVLSAFPFFITEYFGFSVLDRISLEKQNDL